MDRCSFLRTMLGAGDEVERGFFRFGHGRYVTAMLATAPTVPCFAPAQRPFRASKSTDRRTRAVEMTTLGRLIPDQATSAWVCFGG